MVFLSEQTAESVLPLWTGPGTVVFLVSGIDQHPDTLIELEFRSLVEAEVFMRVPSLDRLNLNKPRLANVNRHTRLMETAQHLVIGLNALEVEQEHLVDHVHDFVVVVLDSHLEIETGELGQVPVGVGVLGPEGGADFVHLLHIGGSGHLLG